MPDNTITKETMRGFLEHLSREHNLVGPADTGKVIEYRPASAADILMDDRVSYKAIKEYYFPQTELMFTFECGDIADNTDIPKYVIFGAKPCDLEALRVMSIVYTTGKYADPFFQRRLKANFLIGVGCKNQKSECFCNEMGVEQEFSDFCDIMLFQSEDGDSYSVEYASEKGKHALKSYSATETVETDFMAKSSGSTSQAEETPSSTSQAEETPSSTSQAEEPPSSMSQAEETPAPVAPKLMLDTEADDAAYFDIIDWAKVTETCKGCGICTYICPTCYCFDFRDISKKGNAQRYKCWDSCMYPKFTLHASGHNPREHRYERYRQRVLHKYKYVPKIFDGAVACTGCGRCIRSCPVGINIKDIANQVRNEE